MARRRVHRVQSHHEQPSMVSLSFLIGFALLVFVIAPLFNDASIEGRVIAPPPPPPTPSMTGGAPEPYDPFSEFPEDPYDPNQPPEDPAALDALLFGELPGEPASPSGTTSSGTSTSTATSQGSTGSSSTGGSSSGSSTQTGERASDESSVRGKQHIDSSSSTTGTSAGGGGSGGGRGGGGSSGRRTGTSTTTASAPTPPGQQPQTSPSSGLAPRVGAASSGVPVQTTPPGSTQVIKPVSQTPAPPTEEFLMSNLPNWVLYAAIGFFVFVFAVILFIIVYLHAHKRKKIFPSSISSTPIGQQSQAAVPMQKVKIQEQPQLPLQDPEIKEVYNYLHDNMSKGYPLQALQEALLKNGFQKDKVQQVVAYLQAGQQAEAVS